MSLNRLLPAVIGLWAFAASIQPGTLHAQVVPVPITLAWDQSSPTGYDATHIERKLGTAGAWELIVSVASAARTWSYSTTEMTRHCYRLYNSLTVNAVYARGLASTPDLCFDVTPAPIPGVIPVPANVRRVLP